MNDDTQAVMVGALVGTAVAVTSAIALIWCLLVTGPDPVDLEGRQYCEMVSIYQQTGGEYGWPDFKRIYEEHCHE